MPDPSIEYYNAALDAIQAGRLEEALKAAESSLTENPKDTETWQLYVIILNALGRTADAQTAAGKLRELGLGETDEFLLQAAAAVTSGDLTTGISCYETALETGEDRPEIHAAYALALWEAKRPYDAIGAARIAVSIAPDDANANYALGHILRLSGEKDEALSVLTRAVNADPHHMLSVYEQGMLLSDKGQLEEALENFTRYLRANPGDPSATQAIESVRQRMRPGKN